MRKSKADRRQETISAFLDNELPAVEMRRFEQLIASDASLRQEVDRQRSIKLAMHRLPKLKAPRRFTLDPEQYGRPVAAGYFKLYPAMRLATALVGIFFVIALGVAMLSLNSAGQRLSSTDLISQALESSSEAGVAAEGEVPLKMQALPETSTSADEALLESEMAAEEAAPAEAPAEAAPRAEEVQVTEEVELATEEIEEQLPVVGDTAAETVIAKEEMAEGIADEGALPRTPPAENQTEIESAAEEEMVVTRVLPSGGGGVRPEEPYPAPQGTPAIGRVEVNPDETAASQPTPSPFPSEIANGYVARSDEADVTATSGQETTAEIETFPVPTRETISQMEEPSPELPVMSLVIVGLGLAVIILAVVTLIIRQRTKL